jgi:hypothetical protein
VISKEGLLFELSFFSRLSVEEERTPEDATIKMLFLSGAVLLP